MKCKSLAQTKLTFLFFVVLAFSIRSIFLNQTINYLEPGSGSDSFFYLNWAKDIVRGNLLGRAVFYALPVYPYFLSLAYLFAGGETFGLVLIQILLGSLNCGLIYLLGRKIFSEPSGITAGLISCLYPMFIFYDRMLLPVSLAIFLGLLLLLALLRISENPTLKQWLGLGLLLGLCIITQAAFLPLAIFILLWIIFTYRWKALVWCLALIFPVILILGMTTWRNYLVGKDPVLLSAHSGINFYIGTNSKANGLFKPPQYMRNTQSGLIEDSHILAEQFSAKKLKPSEASWFWTDRALAFIKTNPSSYLKLLARKFTLFWNGYEPVDDAEYYIFSKQARLLKFPFFHFGLISPLAILGMFLAWPRAKNLQLLYLFAAALMLAVISFFINARYRLIVVPYLILFGAFFLEQVFKLCQEKKYLRLALILPLFLGVYLAANIKLNEGSLAPDSFLHYNQGIYCIDQKKYLEAEQEFQAALEASPYDYMNYFGLANVYAQQNDFTKAAFNYQAALTINPYFADAYFNLGLALERRQEYAAAEKNFKKAIEIKPGAGASHYNLGRVYQQQGRADLASEEYHEALKIMPGNQEILQSLKELYQENAQ